jgi:hypothetical protein
VPLLLLALALVLELSRGHRERLYETPWRIALWTGPLVAVPAMAFTGAILIGDVTKTGSWTLTRQNVGALRGDEDCGFADDALVAARDSMQPLRSRGTGGATTGQLPPAPVRGLRRFALGPGSKDRTPWFDLSQRPRVVGFFVAGTPSAPEPLELEWGRKRNDRIESIGTGEVLADLGSEVRSGLLAWRFLASSELPVPDVRANAVRIGLSNAGTATVTVGVTAPVSYTSEPLSRQLRGRDPVSLVLPNLLTYVPCVRKPRLSDGAVAVPSRIAGYVNSWPVGIGTSPFDGLFDLYRLIRLPLTDQGGAPTGVAVYEVDQRIAGSMLVPPTAAPSS